MKTNITKNSTTAVLLGAASLANAADPVPVPGIYATGPAAPILNMTDMRDTERVAYSLGEAAMQTTEAYVYVNGCKELETDVLIYSHPASGLNFLRDNSFGGIELNATLNNPIAGFGQHIDVALAAPATLFGHPVAAVSGRYSYSSRNNLMVNEKTGIEIKGQLRGNDHYYSSVIKDFFHGNTYDEFGDFYVMYDYGLQSLSKFGYPVNKWWQKSKSVRDNGQQGCFVLQKDRLVGAGQCRITLATTGLSQPGLFWQDGTLKVSPVNPSAPDSALEGCGVNPIFP